MPVRWPETLLPTRRWRRLLSDAKATVQVEQASAENNGVATVTVTAEDGTAKTYTVTFGELPQLAELAVEVDQGFLSGRR